MVQPILQEMSLKEVHEPFSSNSRGPIHKKRRLQIEELDEWRTHKPRTHDEPKLRQNKLNTFPNQLKAGDKVLLDAADPHIVTAKPNEEISLTVFNFFPFGTVEVSHPKFGTFKINTGVGEVNKDGHGSATLPRAPTCPRNTGMGQLYTMSSSRGKKTAVPASKKRKGASSSSGPTAKIRHPFLQFPIGPQEELFQILRARPLIAGRCIDWATVEQVRLVHQLSVPEFSTTLGLYTEEFKEKNGLHALNRHIHCSPSRCWGTPGEEKALASLPLTTSTTYGVDGAISEGGHLYWPLCDPTSATLWAPRHRSTRIILDPYWPDVSSRHLEHAKHEYDRKAPRNLPSSISSRPIYRGGGLEDIIDDVPPQHEDPASQPPRSHYPVHTTASYADIS
ncbi:hypothetical protein GOBAR_AA17912 [Gossypium barbadense]|uniref:Uncharacterized protein n=1 Tax=Gossypium barbadense TaxID=3634 RepID=A0A2P5XHC8_GOSBA|nr:hypothetical protein GOBAR_AA17912 [Gossypium barbadense]